LHTWRILFSALAVIASFPALAAETAAVEEIRVIPVGNGLNCVQNLTTDGHDGLIVQGWRENGNAHGYNRYMVLVKEGRSLEVVTIVDPPGAARGDGVLQDDTIRDDPHTFEDAVRSVKFARAKVNGIAATILIVATRDLSHAQSLADATPVDVDVYRLTRNPGDVGWPEYYFALAVRERLKGTYRNADCALAGELRIPLADSEAALCAP
jgi:hypothetical protein